MAAFLITSRDFAQIGEFKDDFTLLESEREDLLYKEVLEKDLRESANIWVDHEIDLFVSDFADVLDEWGVDGGDVFVDELFTEELLNPIKKLVKGRISDGAVEIGFTAIVHQNGLITVVTDKASPAQDDVVEIAAQIVQERILNYIDE